MKVSKVGYVIVETKEKEVDDSITLQKESTVCPWKEEDKWKIEEVRTIEKNNVKL